MSRIDKYIQIEIRLVVVGTGGNGKWGNSANG